MRRKPLSQGFTLIELLVVLVIVGVLAIVGVTTLTPRPSVSVRSVLDEVEGTLVAAQKSTMTTSRDIFLSSSGDWVSGTLVLDGRPLLSTLADPLTAADLVAGADNKRVGGNNECFRSRSPKDRDHSYAGIETGNGWYAAALAGGPGLADTAPINTQADFVAALGNPLFTGAANTIVINGLTKRFATGFSVVVVGLRDGQPVPGGPIGVIVVPQNSASVYKFYKSASSAEWRKL
nr:prepilin-type N-terminal cleavage/methylation domain-containing protein [uncultured Holophaga sp.]